MCCKFAIFVCSILNCISLLAIGSEPIEKHGEERSGAPGITHGPFVGHTSSTTAMLWARCATSGRHTAELVAADTGMRFSSIATARPENDRCVVWKFDHLAPGRTYQYSISRDGTSLAAGEGFFLTTSPRATAPSRVRIAFGSCATEDVGTAGVWRRLLEIAPDAIVLLGDTPYIDSTDLAIQRKRYREFAAVAEMRSLLQKTSWYGTWDDHDFGRNDTDGRLPGKEHSRKAFIEYHANPSYGNGGAGIFTSFRRGGVEVFLLDTRFFAATEATAGDIDQPTLLGHSQWKWLRAALKNSTAPFKILACGMIWNGATRPNKPDHWGSYPVERKALLRFLGQEKISGVVLIGGDIHRSRALRYPTKNIVGYDLVELITSPMHDRIIEAANAPHPSLIFDAGEPHSFLVMTADTTSNPPTLTGEIQNAGGSVLFTLRTTLDELSADSLP